MSDMSELYSNLNYTQQLDRDLKQTETNLMARWHRSRQRLIKRAEKLAEIQTQQKEKLAEMKGLIREIVDLIFKDMEGFFFDQKTQQKIEKKLPITALDLDNE
jgi:hypothetical protein